MWWIEYEKSFSSMEEKIFYKGNDRLAITSTHTRSIGPVGTSIVRAATTAVSGIVGSAHIEHRRRIRLRTIRVN